MEAILFRATVATAGAVLQAGGHGHGIQVRAILAERSSKLAAQGAANSSRKGSFRQSGFAAPHRSATSQTEMLGPLRILWNGSSSNDQASRISEETSTFLDDEELEGSGFLNYETLDQSVADGNEDNVDCGYSRVVHTQESFTKFLRPLVSANELKDVAQACYLSNLAYIISEIKVMHCSCHFGKVSSDLSEVLAYRNWFNLTYTCDCYSIYREMNLKEITA
jgi:hypothetical protein